MSPIEVVLPAIHLVGIKLSTTQEDLATTSAEAWRRAGELNLDSRIRHLKEPNVTLECQFNWSQAGLWTFMLAMEVASIEDVPEGADTHSIPAGTWLVFDLPGTIPNINVPEAWPDIIDWFSKNDRRLPFLSFVQRYDDASKKAKNLIQLEAIGT